MPALLGSNQNTEGGGKKGNCCVFTVSEHTAILWRWQVTSFRLVHFPPGSLCPGAIF